MDYDEKMIDKLFNETMDLAEEMIADGTIQDTGTLYAGIVGGFEAFVSNESRDRFEEMRKRVLSIAQKRV